MLHGTQKMSLAHATNFLVNTFGTMHVKFTYGSLVGRKSETVLLAWEFMNDSEDDTPCEQDDRLWDLRIARFIV